MAPALASMPQLTSLMLARNRLKVAGMVSLAPVLASMWQLRSLDLTDNDLQAAGAASLAAALTSMPQLTSLGLERYQKARIAKLSGALRRFT